MKNMDELAKQKAEIVAKINQAVKDGNEEAFSEAFLEYTELLQDAVMAEARGMVQAADNQVLAGRGIR
ncbi:MAG: phage major capsid protein, partial [Limnochordia bacterium]